MDQTLPGVQKKLSFSRMKHLIIIPFFEVFSDFFNVADRLGVKWQNVL